MKKLVCLWMTLAMLLGVCPALAQDDAAVGALLEQLDAYLACSEALYAPWDATLQSMQDFSDAQDYASLLEARIAADSAYQTMQRLTVPAFTLTGDALAMLMALGVETDALEAEIQNLDTVREMTGDTMSSFEARLERILVQRDGLDSFVRWTKLDREYMLQEISYTWAMVNYLLLPVASDAQVAAFWDAIPGRYPVIGSRRPAWNTDGDALVDQVLLQYEEMESLLEQIAVEKGRLAYLSEQQGFSLQEDTETLKAGRMIISGMPAIAPLPDGWMEPETSAIIAGERAGDLPSALTLEDPAVTLEAFSEYVGRLTDEGAALSAKDGSDGTGWTIALTLGDAALTLQWLPDQTARITYDPACISLESTLYVLSCR
ncbi:MAG: hypothetical protein ACI4O7_11375 [Aristaeellaceae bacterium]